MVGAGSRRSVVTRLANSQLQVPRLGRATDTRGVRRIAFLALRWLLLFTVTAAIWLLFPSAPLRERVGPALAFGAGYATLWPITATLTRRLRTPRSPDHLCHAAWRVYADGDARRGRWREGRLDATPAGVAACPAAGPAGPRLDAATVSDVTERALTWREAIWMGDRRRVLEVSHAGGRADLAVEPADVATVRRKLGR